jgi:hypothetical protein
MSQYLRHEPCPKCGPIQDGSGNNLGVFDDGHKWCFACGFYVPSSGIISLQDVRGRLSRQAAKNFQPAPQLPFDHTYFLPPQAHKWLQKYALTDEEQRHNRIGWSAQYERMIFPVYDGGGNLLMWQGRYCPVPDIVDSARSKYYTQGNTQNVLALFGYKDSDQQVVVVEDFISAIKVARVCPSLCLWGSEISLTLLKRLSNKFSHLIIWLDQDKTSHATRCAVKARPYFEQVTSIFTNNDPKTYSTEELKQWILSR